MFDNSEGRERLEAICSKCCKHCQTLIQNGESKHFCILHRISDIHRVAKVLSNFCHASNFFGPEQENILNINYQPVKYLIFSTSFLKEFQHWTQVQHGIRQDWFNHTWCVQFFWISSQNFFICFLYRTIFYGNSGECCLGLLDKGNISYILCKESWEDGAGLDKQKTDQKRSECK